MGREKGGNYLHNLGPLRVKGVQAGILLNLTAEQ